jgi:hypothetical protein
LDAVCFLQLGLFIVCVQVLGWAPNISLKDGITKTYAWIQGEIDAEKKAVHLACLARLFVRFFLHVCPVFPDPRCFFFAAGSQGGKIDYSKSEVVVQTTSSLDHIGNTIMSDFACFLFVRSLFDRSDELVVGVQRGRQDDEETQGVSAATFLNTHVR